MFYFYICNVSPDGTTVILAEFSSWMASGTSAHRNVVCYNILVILDTTTSLSTTSTSSRSLPNSRFVRWDPRCLEQPPWTEWSGLCLPRHRPVRSHPVSRGSQSSSPATSSPFLLDLQSSLSNPPVAQTVANNAARLHHRVCLLSLCPVRGHSNVTVSRCLSGGIFYFGRLHHHRRDFTSPFAFSIVLAISFFSFYRKYTV